MHGRHRARIAHRRAARTAEQGASPSRHAAMPRPAGNAQQCPAPHCAPPCGLFLFGPLFHFPCRRGGVVPRAGREHALSTRRGCSRLQCSWRSWPPARPQGARRWPAVPGGRGAGSAQDPRPPVTTIRRRGRPQVAAGTVHRAGWRPLPIPLALPDRTRAVVPPVYWRVRRSYTYHVTSGGYLSRTRRG